MYPATIVSAHRPCIPLSAYLTLPYLTLPAASTVTKPRSSAAKAARVRALASLRHRLASSSSSPRSTTSCAPCRAATTARARTVRASSLILQGLRVCQTNSGSRDMSLAATIAFDTYVVSSFALWSAHSPTPRTASSQTATRTQGASEAASRASSALCGGGDGCQEDIRWDRCARPRAVRVTTGPRSFSVHHFFPIV